MDHPEIFKILEHAAEQFPDQLPRIEHALNSISGIAYWPHNLTKFAESMMHLSTNPNYADTHPRLLKVYELLQSLQKEGILPDNTISSVNEFFKSMCVRYNIVTTAAQASALSAGLGLAAVAAGLVIGSVAAVHLAPEGFFDPEDNPLLPDDSGEDVERFRHDRIKDKIKNNIPFCQYVDGLHKCLPTKNSEHDDERRCYVKGGECKVNKGWVDSAYKWWSGKDTDTPLFYKTRRTNTFVPLTAEKYNKFTDHQPLYNQDGSLFTKYVSQGRRARKRGSRKKHQCFRKRM
jgi:hypothetical protein